MGAASRRRSAEHDQLPEGSGRSRSSSAAARAHLLFSSNGDDYSDQLSANVHAIGADGSDLTQLTHDTNGSHSFTPDWSPDATEIVFAHAGAIGSDLA